jgi:hypothetical protein
LAISLPQDAAQPRDLTLALLGRAVRDAGGFKPHAIGRGELALERALGDFQGGQLGRVPPDVPGGQ